MKDKKKNQSRLEGIISITSKGTGYVTVPGHKEDFEVVFRDLNTALHGDEVEVVVHPKIKTRKTAEVTRIISRSKKGFAGVLELENNMYFVKPDDTKMYTDILIPKESLGDAMIGEKVYAELTSWKDPMKNPEGKVTRVLGKPGDNNAEMESIAIERGFVARLPDEVEKEAQRISERGITQEDYKNRRDFRKTLTFTIDPADAKDFDDAISFKELGKDTYELGVHIADVTHYVTLGGVIDKEARDRGTSVYLVDRTIPMLPEALSNDLCSLVPDQDRLTMSAVFVIDKNAEVKEEWYGKTVIHSQKRFTYEEAEIAIKDKTKPLHKELDILNKIAKKLTKERFAKGAMSLEAEEVKFVLDAKGKPVKVIKKVRGDSNKLIEEFMLLANRKVAEKITLSNKGGVFVYRIHDLPQQSKMEDLAFFLRSLGHKVTLKNGVIPSFELNKLLASLEGKNERDAVHRAVIRSMAKAVYSVENIGHYGLAFKYYTHFTSPIRRYPDMLVHRMLADFLDGIKVSKDKSKIYERLTFRASEQEKKAAEAERASIKYKQVEYMASRVGEKFDGIISGITEWGMYVEEIQTKCEGMIKVRDMDDYYTFDEKRLALIGQKKKKVFKLGDRVKIKVKGIDLERRTIDYVLA